MEAYQPVSQKLSLDESDLLNVARQATESSGYVPVETDGKPYAFETRQKEVAVSSVPRISYRYTFQVSTKGGTLSIVATCVENSSMHREKYDPCGDERPQHVIDEQDRLKKAILERVKQASK